MKLGDLVTMLIGKVKFCHRCVGFDPSGTPIVRMDSVVSPPMAQIMHSRGKERFYIHVLRDGKWGMEHGPFMTKGAAQAHVERMGYDLRKGKHK